MSSLDAKQGGDTDESISLDLSTCINAYGPPPRCLETPVNFRSLVHKHPFTAASTLIELYAAYLDVDARHLVAIRGASEGIALTARFVAPSPVALPGPTYTEFLRYFKKSDVVMPRTSAHDPTQIEIAAKTSAVVAFSNPHNPSGAFVDPIELDEVYRRSPDTIFLVDESYADFLGTHPPSMQPNVISLRSPSKFFGIAGVRVGVVHCTSLPTIERFKQMQTTWPVSALEVEIARVAFDSHEWSSAVRMQLQDDSAWLDRWLADLPGISVLPGAQMHFRLVTGNIDALHSQLYSAGIATRVLDTSHGLDQPALRITAPIESRRKVLQDSHPS